MNSFKKLFNSRPLLDWIDRDEKEKVLYLIIEIKEEEPFTALGFFRIERSTLTTILLTILTYLIVLVQFQSDDRKNDKTEELEV